MPFKYVIRGSAIDKYLYQLNKNSIINTTPSYDPEYIKHNCQSNYLVVYLEFIWMYLLPLGIFVLYIYISRRALLIYQP